MINNFDELKELILKNPKTKFKVKACPNSKKESIDFLEEYIKIKVLSPAIDGRANKAIVEILSKNLGIAKSKIKLLSPQSSSIKVFQVKM